MRYEFMYVKNLIKIYSIKTIQLISLNLANNSFILIEMLDFISNFS